MTDQEVIDMYEAMLKHFGSLPDPIHEPIRFAHYVKVYQYYMSRK